MRIPRNTIMKTFIIYQYLLDIQYWCSLKFTEYYKSRGIYIIARNIILLFSPCIQHDRKKENAVIKERNIWILNDRILSGRLFQLNKMTSAEQSLVRSLFQIQKLLRAREYNAAREDLAIISMSKSDNCNVEIC